VQQAAAAVLLQLVTGLKASLALASHPELARSEYGDSLACTAAATAAGVAGADAAAAQGDQDTAATAGGSNVSRSFLAAARLAPGGGAAAAALAAARAPVLNPSCPNCYPQLPMPGDDMLSGTTAAAAEAQWRLAGVGMWEQQQCVDVTAAVNSICLQVRDVACMQPVPVPSSGSAAAVPCIHFAQPVFRDTADTCAHSTAVVA
jgi:hypothetical protein